MKIRYGEREYLCEYDLNVDLFSEFDIKVYDVIPVRGVYILETDKGQKILKKINYNIERLNFIYDSTCDIRKNYEYVMSLNKNINDENFVCRDGDRYILIDLIEGRECGFTNPVDIDMTSKSLAMMHNASMNFVGSTNTEEKYKGFYKYKNQKEEFKNALKCLRGIKKNIENYIYKNEFDKLFLENVKYYMKNINECIKLLISIDFEEYIKDDKIVLCHNDLAHHNMIIKEDLVYFIDFDYCDINFRMKDLANFILKSIKNYGFQISKCESILENYGSEYEFSYSDYLMLYIYLLFPHDFYTISKNYYFKEKKWDEDVFLSRLLNKTEFKEDREEFFKNFKEKYLNNKK